MLFPLYSLILISLYHLKSIHFLLLLGKHLLAKHSISQDPVCYPPYLISSYMSVFLTGLLKIGLDQLLLCEESSSMIQKLLMWPNLISPDTLKLLAGGLHNPLSPYLIVYTFLSLHALPLILQCLHLAVLPLTTTFPHAVLKPGHLCPLHVISC